MIAKIAQQVSLALMLVVLFHHLKHLATLDRFVVQHPMIAILVSIAQVVL
jgi:hypothetical protein